MILFTRIVIPCEDIYLLLFTLFVKKGKNGTDDLTGLNLHEHTKVCKSELNDHIKDERLGK